MLSLLGSLLGFGTSFLPKILGFFEEKRDQAHELRMMDKQLEQQKAIGQQKLQMMHVDADIREGEALLKHDASLQRRASTWVVDFAASVRPVLTYLFFIEFFTLTYLLAFGYITKDFYKTIWDNPTQALFATVVSFWFGSRTFARERHT
jgi:hypothetical protein